MNCDEDCFGFSIPCTVAISVILVQIVVEFKWKELSTRRHRGHLYIAHHSYTSEECHTVRGGWKPPLGVGMVRVQE